MGVIVGFFVSVEPISTIAKVFLVIALLLTVRFFTDVWLPRQLREILPDDSLDFARAQTQWRLWRMSRATRRRTPVTNESEEENNT